jgi:hypothetical protein
MLVRRGYNGFDGLFDMLSDVVDELIWVMSLETSRHVSVSVIGRIIVDLDLNAYVLFNFY